MTDQITVIRHLLALAERDPNRACAEFDQLVARYGRTALAHALREVAGNELVSLGYTA
jgi:CRISPR/Cas system-associated protein Csm6